VLSRMRPENMVVCDLEGYLLEGPPGTAQCNEVKIHSSIYKARPDVQSVVHVHPPYCVMLTLRGLPIRPVVLEGMRLVRRPLPVYPHTALVTSEEQGQAMARLLGDAPAIQLLGHGAVTTGASIEEAVVAMIHLEHQARMNFEALSLHGGGPVPIPEELIDEFLRWKPQSEPHFQDALARVGAVHHLGGMWADLVDRAEADMRSCGSAGA
jgi:ribulose-5-phosphate 4-epimerase/fuculose-1-phosphate aldolase